MKRLLIPFLMLITAGYAFAQTPPATPPAASTPPPASPAETVEKPLGELFSWLVGNWKGQGADNGQPYAGEMSVTVELDGQAILVRRRSESGYSEIMTIGFDATSKKIVATLFTSGNHSAIYVGSLDDHQVTLSEATNVAGYVSDRTFALTAPGTVVFTIRAGAPGEQVKQLLTVTFKNEGSAQE